jgi:TolB protein
MRIRQSPRRTNATPVLGKDNDMNHIARHHMTWRSQAVAVAAAALVAGCASSTGTTVVHGASSTPAPTSNSTAAAPAAAHGVSAVTHGVEAPIGAIPWSNVGPGWMLAVWNAVTPHHPGALPAPAAGPAEPTDETASSTLYLVDPAGNRYPITTFAPPSGFEGPRLVDWSGDGSHALLSRDVPGQQQLVITQVDLHTGAQTTLPDGGRYTRPDGKSMLVSTNYNGDVPGTLKRVDLAGNPQLTFPTDQLGGEFSGAYMQSPDGTRLVLGTVKPGNVPGNEAYKSPAGLVLVRNDGTVVRRLSSPAPDASCSPVRWWNATEILANCDTAEHSGSQLWEVPLNGGAPMALTALNSGQEDDPGFGGDIGDRIAWQLPSGTFLQSAGACGTMFLSRLTPDMHTTRVDVPGIDSSSVVVAGATADKLVLQAKVGCGATTSLLTYDPAANTSTVLLGPPINGGGVTEAMLYPGQN